MTIRELHPTIAAAAAGRLPDWARVSRRRMPHLESVSDLLLRWSSELNLEEVDRARWAAAGWLHDALRDAPPEQLAGDAAEFPSKVRHGPAAAAMLRGEGVADEELLEAVTFHSLGCGGLRRLGRFLFLADYLEPRRAYAPQENAVLRAQLPENELAVLRTVCARRIGERLQRHRSLRQETVDFWNELAADR